MKALILAGGGGTRLWPLSHEDHPKQFIGFDGQGSLLQNTLLRCEQIGLFSEILVISNRRYQSAVETHVAQCGIQLPVQVISEPCRRNTAPAIALGLSFLLSQSDTHPDDVICVFPADHQIPQRDNALLFQCLQQAEIVARSQSVVTFGIVPTEPETGYGYIQIDQPIPNLRPEVPMHFPVSRFVEKPSYEVAQEYVNSKRFLWNSGMFVFTPQMMLEAFEQHCPDIYQLLAGLPYPDLVEVFGTMPDISIDYAVMEKTDRAHVIPLHIGWSDLGSWDSVFNSLPKDAQDNLLLGNATDSFTGLESSRNLFLSTIAEKQVAAIGVTDLIVVDTPDALFITRQGLSQRVKELNRIPPASVPTASNTQQYDWGTLSIEWQDTRAASNLPMHLIRLTISPMQTLSFPGTASAHIQAGLLYCPESHQWFQAGTPLALTPTMTLQTTEQTVELVYLMTGPLEALNQFIPVTQQPLAVV